MSLPLTSGDLLKLSKEIKSTQSGRRFKQ